MPAWIDASTIDKSPLGVALRVPIGEARRPVFARGSARLGLTGGPSAAGFSGQRSTSNESLPRGTAVRGATLFKQVHAPRPRLLRSPWLLNTASLLRYTLRPQLPGL